MKYSFYSYYTNDGEVFFFTSEGKNMVNKVVEFTAVEKNIVNLGFGDLLPDGSYDDMVISNNGDVRKVLTTVVQIVVSFREKNPHKRIVFAGSSPGRTRFYNRIINTYYHEFSDHFIITTSSPINPSEKIYDPDIVLDDSYFYLIPKL